MTATTTGTLVPDLELQPCKSSQRPSPQCTAARHGTLRAYNVNRCRCPAARAAHTRDEKRRRLEALEGRTRLVDATGTHRRLRALMAIGWRSRDLAPRIGWASGELDTIFRRPTVRRITAARVQSVYQQLADHPGPSQQTRRRAERAGWLAPLWWDDDTIDNPSIPDHGKIGQEPVIDQVAIERYRGGETSIKLTRAEKQAALTQLVLDGVSISAAGAQLGVNATYARRYAAAAAGLTVLARREHAQTDPLEETA